jgi:hypothetical protein
MKKHLSLESRSFIILFTIAVFGVFASWFMYKDYSKPTSLFETVKTPALPIPQAIKKPQSEPTITIDTADWKTYTNTEYKFEFKYKPEWKIKSINNQNGYYVVEIDPGAKYSNIHIYISQDDYYALSDLPAEKTQVAGKEALSLDGMVLGVKDNANYFTFDLGVSLTLKPLFEAMVNSVKFF